MPDIVAGSASILLVDGDPSARRRVSEELAGAGFQVVAAESGAEALDRLDEATPDLVLTEVDIDNGEGVDGHALVSRLRSDSLWRNLPVIFLTERGSTADVVTGLDLGADDYLVKPVASDELAARVRVKLERRPAPKESLNRNPRTGLLSAQGVLAVAERERSRAVRTGRPGWLAVLQLDETPRLRDRFGERGMDQLAKQVVGVLTHDGQPLEISGHDSGGRFLIVVTDASEGDLRAWLEQLGARLAARSFLVAGEHVSVTPVVGYAGLDDGGTVEELRDHARVAAEHTAGRRDLRPARYAPHMEELAQLRRRPSPLLSRLRTPLQVLVTLVIGVVLPFAAYLLLGSFGVDVSGYVFDIVVLVLVVSAASIWLEGLFAVRPVIPPEPTGDPEPAASAVIAAYLPNEAATIVETVDGFLRQEYAGGLQVILAYNTPHPLPVEGALLELAVRDPRLLLLKVPDSTSKAQNVNAALPFVTGEFVGVFDADHHPEQGSFSRAWRWLSNGYGVVQGHCAVRNGDASWVSRTVAVEFEAIYAVSHPGRARLHGFGIFGGSNGYWRTDLLRATRMRDSMLTEDIDSSLRVVEQGVRIASDPQLVSWELAPATVRSLWNQRTRWAQGWFQASRMHLGRELRSPQLTPRQKIGMFYLLGWREAYPWLALQVYPFIAFRIYRLGSFHRLQWLVPIFVLTTLFTVSVGPGQTVFAYRLAVPELRRHRWWFGAYLVISSLAYTEWKNLIARTAHVKELTGDRQWRVTPRLGAGPLVVAYPQSPGGGAPADVPKPGPSVAADPAASDTVGTAVAGRVTTVRRPGDVVVAAGGPPPGAAGGVPGSGPAA